MQPSCGIDEDGIAPLRLSRRDAVEHHGRGIGTLARANQIHARTASPDFQLLHRRRAKRVCGDDERLLSRRLQQLRKLSDRRGLAGSIDADDQHDVRSMSVRRQGRHCRKDGADLILDGISQALAACGLLLDGHDNAIGRRDADVGHDEQLFERLDGIDVDRTPFALGRLRLRDQLIEPLDDLLCGFGETFPDPIKEPHVRSRALP